MDYGKHRRASKYTISSGAAARRKPGRSRAKLRSFDVRQRGNGSRAEVATHSDPSQAPNTYLVRLGFNGFFDPKNILI